MTVGSRGSYRVVAHTALLAGTALALVVGSCNYNAAVVVNIAKWKGDDKSVVFLGARPTAACDGDPGQLTLSFLLRNERGEGVEEGDRVRVAPSLQINETMVVTTAGASPAFTAADVELQLTAGASADIPDGGIDDGGLAPVGDGGLGLLTPQVTALRYAPLTTGGRSDRRDPIAGALVFDNGADVQADDGDGARVDGAEALAQGVMCYALGADKCRFGPVQLELYDLADSTVEQLAPFLSDAQGMVTKLELLRGSARASGDGPVYDGLVKVGPEVRAQAATLGAGGTAALVLVTRDGKNESHANLTDAVAAVAGAPVFVVSRTDTAELRQLACASGGVVRVAAQPGDYPTAFTEVRDALRGRFEVDITVPELATASPGSYALEGTLAVTLQVGKVKLTASVPVSLTVIKPGS